jgi:hypothetical protein
MDLCYFGLRMCETDTTQVVGQLLPWFELIGIAAIIFAVSEFAETSKTRLFLFQLSLLKSFTIWIVFFSIILVGFANILPLIPGEAVPVLGYPSSYEALVLFLLSFSFLAFCLFLLNPYTFRPRFSFSLLQEISGLLVRRSDQESLSSLIQLLLSKGKWRESYLEQIIKNAADSRYLRRTLRTKDEPEPPPLVILCRDVIDVLLSKDEVSEVIAKEHFHFIEEFVRLAKKHNLAYHQVGRLFMDNLIEKLLSVDGSLLDRESKRGGYEGLYKPVSRLIYTSDYIMSEYSPLPMFFRQEGPHTMKHIVSCLETAVRHYYSKPTSSFTHFLSRSIEDLGEAASHFVYQIPERDDKDLWRQSTPELSTIGHFFHQLEHLLRKEEYWNTDPQFSESELAVMEGSVTEAIAKGAFEFFEAHCWIKNNDDYVRTMLLGSLMWLFFDGHPEGSVHKNIQKKFLELITERVEENLKDHYPSMIKVLANVFGYQLTRERISIVQSYFNEVFEQKIADLLLKDEYFRKMHLPDRWVVEGNVIKNKEGNQIYPILQKRNRKKKNV